MAGQLGMFTRVTYNNKVIDIAEISKKNINREQGFKNYGKIKTTYVILHGSIQGPSKRALILTLPLRRTKKQNKKNYELISLK